MKPDWLKVRIAGDGSFPKVRAVLRELNLRTVCQDARCPNLGDCWGRGTATVMILGETCTRACRFCAVKTGNPRGAVEADEPERVAEAAARLGLGYVVLTSVDRDDLPDGGAGQFAATVRALKARVPDVKIEVLVPDFGGSSAAVRTAFEAGPDVFGHNVETVRRLTPLVRDRRASYAQSLAVLLAASRLTPRVPTKSGYMVGLGETEAEVTETMHDLRQVDVRFLTIGQYLQPTRRHLPVTRYVPPDEFERYRQLGLKFGFEEVMSGPLVRSSYRAETMVRAPRCDFHLPSSIFHPMAAKGEP